MKESPSVKIKKDGTTVFFEASPGSIDTTYVQGKTGIVTPTIVNLTLQPTQRAILIDAFTGVYRGDKVDCPSFTISASSANVTTNIRQYYLCYSTEVSQYIWTQNIISALAENIFIATTLMSETYISIINQSSSVHNNMHQTFAKLCGNVPFLIQEADLTVNELQGVIEIDLTYEHHYMLSLYQAKISQATVRRVYYDPVNKEFVDNFNSTDLNYFCSLMTIAPLTGELIEVFFSLGGLPTPISAMAICTNIYQSDLGISFNGLIPVKWLLYKNLTAVQFVACNNMGFPKQVTSVQCDIDSTVLF